MHQETLASFTRELMKLADDEQPSRSKWLRPAAGAAAATLAGLGAYGLLRKYRPSRIPELRALQEQAKDKAFEIATAPEQNKGIRSMLFGAKDVPAQGLDRKGALLRHTLGRATAEGAVNINAGVLPDALDDKYLFSRLMQEGTGGAKGMEGSIPATHLLSERLQEVGPQNLAKAHPQGYVIKPRTGAMSKAENLLTEATDEADPRMQAALRNPAEFIIQDKIPIQQEFRVHTINNVPFTAVHRQLPNKGLRKVWNKYMGGGGGAFVPAVGEQRSKLMEFARESTKHLGDTAGGNMLGKQENLHHALDIAQLPDGSFKLIESNPVPGTLMNPVISRKLQHKITGRVPKDVAALGGLGAATTAGAGAYGLHRVTSGSPTANDKLAALADRLLALQM